MKENMFDVLLYLFENFISEYPYVLPEEPAELTSALEVAGFQDSCINKAFLWLEGLTDLQMLNNNPSKHTHLKSIKGFRVFNSEEFARLDEDALGFILFLEQHNIIDDDSRELIMDRLMALEHFKIDLEQVKWVTLIVLYHHFQNKEELELIEEFLLLNSDGETLH